MESRQRASPEQFTLMLEFMETHGDLSRPQPGLNGRVTGERRWQELANLLNSVGGSGVNKTVEKWKRVWSDWKTKTKKKASLINRDIHGTGGGPSKAKSLAALEERVLHIIGLTSITGHQALEEAGFEVPSHPQLELQQAVNVIGVALTPPPPPFASSPLPRSNTPPTLAPILIPPTPAPVPFSTPSQLATSTNPVPGPSNRTVEREDRSPASCPSTPCRSQLRRKRVRQNPFDRATSEFVAVEEKRLRLEQERDKRLRELEIQRNQIEADRIRLEYERLQLDTKRLQVENERIRVDETRARIEADRLENERALRESVQQLSTHVAALLSSSKITRTN